MNLRIMRPHWILSNVMMASCLISSSAFATFRQHRDCLGKLKGVANERRRVVCPLLAESTEFDQKLEELESPTFEVDRNPLAAIIRNLTAIGQIEEAVELLRETTTKEHDLSTQEKACLIVLRALDSKRANAPEIADELTNTLLRQGFHPSAEFFNLVVSVWSKSVRKEASTKCIGYLEDLWSYHIQTGEKRLVPLRSSYISTIHALSRSFFNRPGQEQAEKAEALLEEMEAKRVLYPHLAPNTIAVNAVLNTWSKSQVLYGSASRCEQILDRMIKLSRDRPELKPDTTSFNSVIDTLSKSKERDCEKRAESLLEKMQELANNESLSCRPDQVSFNVVINCWAQSKVKGAARRATAILKHMAKRFEENVSDIGPDTATYTTVINAWARSREPDAVERAEEVLEWCEESFRRGNHLAKPNCLTYNSMINCYAKSKLPNANEKASALLSVMKEKSKVKGFEDCHPDVVTYTSVIDTFAKKKSVDAAAKAVFLLEELEKASEGAPDDRRLQPNVRTYTSAINAIGRSGKNPERAQSILNRIEKMAMDGNKAVMPDVVCYNAVINAYGWSDLAGKSAKCFALLQRMIEVSNSGENKLAKPDIITCNSVLNACAFERVEADSERAEIMEIVVKTLETFQKRIPQYGYPDHATYSQVLLAISKHMPPDDKRYEMAEATFWQCCHAGHVSVLVVTALEQALSFPRFATVMGSALKSSHGERLAYDLNLFPSSWTRHTPNRKWGDKSQASRKRDRGFQVTKATLTQAKKIANAAEKK